jgi:hypothetical protein
MLLQGEGELRVSGRRELEHRSNRARPVTNGADRRGQSRRRAGLTGTGQFIRDLGQGVRLPVGVGDRAGDGLGVLMMPSSGQCSRDLGQGVRQDRNSQSGARRTGCGLCPAPSRANGHTPARRRGGTSGRQYTVVVSSTM